MTNKFFELRQAGKLPAIHPIPRLKENETLTDIFSTIVGESEELQDATIELGKDLFGDALKIE